MATTSTIEYCNDRDIYDVYPNISQSDSKSRIFGWVVHSSNLYRADNSGLVTVLFANGQDLGSAQANSGVVNSNGEWFYESTLDAVYYYNDASSPNDLIMESGEDTATFTQRYRRNASRYVESKLDSRLASEVNMDREGSYPYIIKRTTALVAVGMMLKSDDPLSEVANAFRNIAKKEGISINKAITKYQNKKAVAKVKQSFGQHDFDSKLSNITNKNLLVKVKDSSGKIYRFRGTGKQIIKDPQFQKIKTRNLNRIYKAIAPSKKRKK